MICWKCKKELEDPIGKLPFRAECDYCHNWLHTCKNCKNYKPGAPNDCHIPDIELVADKEKNNFCEEFVLQKTHKEEDKGSVSEAAKKLFGEELSTDQNKNFDSLFED